MRKSAYPDLSPGASKPQAAKLAALLKRTALFKNTPPGALAALSNAARLRLYERGEFVCHSGEPARELWVVIEGRVSISRLGWSGTRRSVELMVPGDAFGLPALAALCYPSDIQARVPTTLAVLPKDEVAALVQRVPGLAQTVFEMLAQRLQFVETMLLLSNEPVERRLAATLVYLHHKFGAEIELSRVEIAEMAGIAPETTMRLLKRFEAAGRLRRRPDGVSVIDAPALRLDSLG